MRLRPGLRASEGRRRCRHGPAVAPLLARRGTRVTDCGRRPLAYARPVSGSEFAPSGALMGCAKSKRAIHDAFPARSGHEPKPTAQGVTRQRRIGDPARPLFTRASSRRSGARGARFGHSAAARSRRSHDRIHVFAGPELACASATVPLVRSRLERALTWSKHEQREPPLVHDVVSPPLTVR
jgi:hypothetical protein